MTPPAVRFAAVALCGVLAACAEAVIGPKTIVDRAIEARSTADIAEDNRIVVAANKAMANAELLSWSDALALDAKVGIDLIGTAGVADVNYRVAVDPFATVYLLGRARSQGELDKALAGARGSAGVRKVVNYVEVRP